MLFRGRIDTGRSRRRRWLFSVSIFVLCFVFPLVSQGLPSNIVILCSTNNLPNRLSILNVEEEKIDRASLLGKWIPEKTITDYTNIEIGPYILKRYNDKSGRTVVDFGPFGYTSIIARSYLTKEQTEILSEGKSSDFADSIIFKNFGDIPVDAKKAVTPFTKGAGLSGYTVHYKRIYGGYEIVAADQYLGDQITVNLYKTGDLELRRLWHTFSGMGGVEALSALFTSLANCFTSEIEEQKKILISRIDVGYIFNPLMPFSETILRPAYILDANGRRYVIDALGGVPVPQIMLTVDVLIKPRMIVPPPVELKRKE